MILSIKKMNLPHFRYQTFTANTDFTTIVENRLSTPVIALCIRLYPLTWFGFPCLRMEVLGCIRNYSTSIIYHQEPLIISQGI